MTTRKFGRLPADPTKPKLRLRRAPAERPTPPQSCDWLSAVRTWGMLANDSVGDCTAAAAGHVAMAVDKYGQGRDLVLTDEQVLQMYANVSGYNPDDPSSDVGATLQDACDYWHKTGIAGNRIAAYAWIDPADLDLVRDCIAIFGAVYCGMWVTQAAMDQLDAGENWTTTSKRSPMLGGHCIPIGAYRLGPDAFWCVTWGQVQAMSVPFFRRWVDEVIVPIDLDWLTAAGVSPAGLDVAALNADYETLTGQPGPFTPPAPVPVPSPTDVEQADRELIAAFEKWKAAQGY